MKSIILGLLLLLLITKVDSKSFNKFIHLEVKEKEFIITCNDTLKLNLELINSGSSDISIYRFQDMWWGVPSDQISHEYWSIGLNIAIYNHKNEFIYEDMSAGDNDPKIMEGLLNKESRDSTISVLKEQYGTAAQWKNQETKIKQDIEKNKKILKPNESLKLKLTLSLKDYFLDKGEYNLYVYYVINQDLFRYLGDEPKSILMGCVKSNKIKVIVK